MHSEFAAECITMRKLSDPELCARFLHALEGKLGGHSQDSSLWQMRADICRRAGNIWEARDAFYRALKLGRSGSKSRLGKNNVTPTKLCGVGNTVVAPVAVFDDFLCSTDLDRLVGHALDNEGKFVRARTHGPDATYDPGMRETLVFHDFTEQRAAFEAFARSNAESLSRDLGLAPFEIAQIELKITNHVDRSFFSTHCDNAEPFEKAGRAITWLLYFGREPVKYSGGDLYIFDTDPETQRYASHSFTKIIPKHNRLVAFPSHFQHAVSPMHLPGNAFADGRFAVSSHISKKAQEARA